MNAPPGSFFLVSIGGASGFAIGVAQALCAAPSRYAHAGIVISNSGDIVEAEPGGARIGNLTEYAGRAILICDGPVQTAMQKWEGGQQDWSETALRQTVVAQARKMVGTPYSALDYAALALLHWGLPSGWVRRRVERSGRMICSQLADAAYRRAGIHLFSDGRLSGDVMPADLANWAEDWKAAC